MKGFPLIARTLAACKAEPRTIRALSVDLGIGYISMMRLVNELRMSGLIAKIDQEPPRRNKGVPAAVYGFKGGEAFEGGRPWTGRFLRLWNALQDPDSARNIAEEIGVNENHVRLTIHDMRRLGLCRVAGWQRGPVSLPTALYELGDKRDAPRPVACTEQEYNRRAAVRRKNRALFDALTFRAAA